MLLHRCDRINIRCSLQHCTCTALQLVVSSILCIEGIFSTDNGCQIDGWWSEAVAETGVTVYHNYPSILITLYIC